MAMEESGEYRVTRSKGRGPGRKIRKVIFRHLDEAPSRRFYKRTPPAPGYIIGLWRPDGACSPPLGPRSRQAMPSCGAMRVETVLTGCSFEAQSCMICNSAFARCWWPWQPQ